MPEGPSIVILKEEAQRFEGKKVLKVGGNAKIDLQRARGKKVKEVLSWGKHFLICFDDFYFRIHLLMFGTYRINERKEADPRLSLKFYGSELNFYTCSVKLFEGDPRSAYNWESDTMSDQWDHHKALEAVSKFKKEMICDVLLDQDIFAGVGNIIKNEALFIAKLHPESLIGNIPPRKLNEIVKVNREYCFDFYKWKKKFVLRKHWLVYRKPACPRCDLKIRISYPGKRKRKTYCCDNCQKLYKISPKKKTVQKKTTRKLKRVA
jgi:endonuclease VIII